MIKVITYGTYDLLHEGHIKLLERAKALGDYLIVGVTADGFDKARGKINVQQSLIERIEAVKKTGLADKIIIEEYEGQKIDDIRRYGANIFTVGSDWKGKFDYLNEFCKVIYLDRTKGVSSTQIRSDKKPLRIGIIGESRVANKFFNESKYVNGVTISGICEMCIRDSNNRRRIHFLHTDGVWTSRFRHPLKPGDGNGTAGNRKRESDIYTWIHIHHSAPPAHSAIRHN